MARRTIRTIALVIILSLPAAQARAQFGLMMGGFGMMGGMMGGFGMMGGMMGGMGGMAGGAGVHINPDGVLTKVDIDPTGRLSRERFAKAKAETKDYTRSDLRKLSLNRLEKAVKARLDKKEGPTTAMLFLACITRIQYVMLLPETNDIVIAGPAEPGFIDVDGEIRGIDSLRPMIHLQDLVAAMRAYPPGGRYTFSIGCSIDPRPENLTKMKQFVAQISRSGVRSPKIIVEGLRSAMGKQDITVTGVSPKTHFAETMVAADYRMKLIGIGVEKPPVKIASYVDLSRGGSANALVRWYFTPNYESVIMSEDHLAMGLVGDGVKLVGADEVVRADGTRLSTTASDGASKRFVTGFTAHYPELAAKVPVYAQLRNLIDLTVAAAYMQKEDLYGKAGHRFELFMNEDRVPIEVYPAPKEVDTVVTAVWKGSRLVTPMGGGVHIEPRQALEANNLLPDKDGKLSATRKVIDIKDLPADRWWWD